MKNNRTNINENNENIENNPNKNSSKVSSNIIINTSYYQVFNGNIENINQNNITNNSNTNIIKKEINKDNSQIKNNNQNINDKNNKYNKCFLCEKTYKKELLFCSECYIHPFCRDCLNAYYGQIIEKENQNLECPIYKCNSKINLANFKNILDDKYYNELNNIKIYNKTKKII